MSVTESLNTLFRTYCTFYPDRLNPINDISSLRLDKETRAKVVDTGICFKIAQWVTEQVPGSTLRVIWRSYRGYDDEPVHCVIEHEGAYYDATNQEGVPDWKFLHWCRNNKNDYLSPHPHWDEEGIRLFGNTGDSPFFDHLSESVKS